MIGNFPPRRALLTKAQRDRRAAALAPATDDLLLENGDFLLLESGDNILLESSS